MSSRTTTSASSTRSAHPRCTGRRLVLGTLLAAGATAAIGLEASADAPEAAATPVRTVTVTADDAIAHAQVDRPALAMALTEALEARTELVATEPEPEPKPEPEPEPAAHSGRIPLSTWERVARCESGGNWSIDTGNGFYGGLQFELRSWEWVGGSGYPHEATKAEQIHRAELLHERQGWNAWPACSRKLGLR
jgi:hypothetical protein